ncbi:hypothetical protein E2C01_051266 [Portunus trituberculatus]|uniref:Uncharacterized protein n=1 Tax=Portunus trituberculatus TaxID=210409 RepID=A0A5B7GIF6_PORTR|nr:hypothetical protein [Portunus trituberculatus]
MKVKIYQEHSPWPKLNKVTSRLSLHSSFHFSSPLLSLHLRTSHTPLPPPPGGRLGGREAGRQSLEKHFCMPRLWSTAMKEQDETLRGGGLLREKGLTASSTTGSHTTNAASASTSDSTAATPRRPWRPSSAGQHAPVHCDLLKDKFSGPLPLGAPVGPFWAAASVSLLGNSTPTLDPA